MTRFRPRIWLSALVLLALCGTACKKRGPGTEISTAGLILPVPEARSENGWPLYEVPAEGFALALPPEWRQFDMNPATFEQTYRDAIRANPQLEAVYPDLLQHIKPGLKFFGVDEPSMGSGFTTHVSVLRLTLPEGFPLELFVSEIRRQLENGPHVRPPVVRERVKTAAGDTERLRLTLTMHPRPGETAVVASTQYYFAMKTDVYVMTLSAPADREAQYRSTFDQIGASFRFVK
jgi:hypothetical protein